MALSTSNPYQAMAAKPRTVYQMRGRQQVGKNYHHALRRIAQRHLPQSQKRRTAKRAGCQTPMKKARADRKYIQAMAVAQKLYQVGVVGAVVWLARAAAITIKFNGVSGTACHSTSGSRASSLNKKQRLSRDLSGGLRELGCRVAGQVRKAMTIDFYMPI